jgi:hypothetical protein
MNFDGLQNLGAVRGSGCAIILAGRYTSSNSTIQAGTVFSK